ncbi:MAG: hypothetical protein ACD_77C00310G0015 [uncultured bacterium]|nr:MAG: hypothetical protein ACD_77C00310G0015 [uncultured bacterium]HBY02411.1 hypothetical protein [Rikenellaceae bacterium]
MDENDKNIKELFVRLSDESVPFNFEEKIQRKIENKLARRKEIRELGFQISIAALTALVISAVFYYLNIKYFNIDLSNIKYLTAGGVSLSGKVKSMFSGNDSLLWIIIGLNVVLLIFAERIISEKLSQKEKGKGE